MSDIIAFPVQKPYRNWKPTLEITGVQGTFSRLVYTRRLKKEIYRYQIYAKYEHELVDWKGICNEILSLIKQELHNK